MNAMSSVQLASGRNTMAALQEGAGGNAQLTSASLLRGAGLLLCLSQTGSSLCVWQCKHCVTCELMLWDWQQWLANRCATLTCNCMLLAVRTYASHKRIPPTLHYAREKAGNCICVCAALARFSKCMGPTRASHCASLPPADCSAPQTNLLGRQCRHSDTCKLLCPCSGSRNVGAAIHSPQPQSTKNISTGGLSSFLYTTRHPPTATLCIHLHPKSKNQPWLLAWCIPS